MKYNLLGAVSTIALGAAFGIGTPGAANASLLTCSAGNIVGSGTCTETVNGNPATVTPTTRTLNLDQWTSNASAGFTETLTGVKFTVTEGLFGQGGVKNLGTTSAAGFFSVSSFTLVASPLSGAPSNFLSPAVDVVNTGGFKGPTITLGAGASTPYAYLRTLTSGLQTVTGSLAGFTGGGTFSALVTAALGNGGFLSNPTGNFSGSVTTTAAPTIALTYLFTTSQPPPPPSPTPEPASLALLCAGLAGLGAVRRRRKN